MVNTKLETQRKTILHFWLNDIRLAKEICQRTKIPLRTIKRNLQKLRETGTVERKHSRADNLRLHRPLHIPWVNIFVIILP